MSTPHGEQVRQMLAEAAANLLCQKPQTSNTPETDANCWMQTWEGYPGEIINSNFARRLERERDAAREEAAMWRMHIKTCLQYPRGSEAQVRCLEEVGGDAAYYDKQLTKKS
jgi:hypothetical protein